MANAKPTVTVEQFKQWAIDCAPAAKAVLMAQAFAELERKRVDAYIRPIFESYTFTYDLERRGVEPGKRMTNPEHLYMSTDEVQVAAYFAECDRAHRAHGFKGPAGHCPALTAEHLLIVTQQALMDLAQPLFGISDVYGDDRAKYLKLLIGACAPHIKGGL